jgi:hypothetical protein
MKYIIVADSSSSGLEDRVNNYISLGWKPCGGISISKYNWYYQAMIKE